MSASPASSPDRPSQTASDPAPEASEPRTGRSPLATVALVLVSAVVLAGVVGFFRYSASKHTGAYRMVDQVVVAYTQWLDKPIQVHGWVEPGSIHEEIVDQQTVRTFVLEHKGKRILVRNKGPKPDSFRDRSEVVAEGKLIEENGQPVLIATNLMAKCPSKYEGAPRDKLFEE